MSNTNNILAHLNLGDYSFTHCSSEHPQQLDPIAYGFNWHTLPMHELLIVLKGNCKKINEQEEIPLSPGDICYHAAFTPHALEIVEDTTYERFVIHFKQNKKIEELVHSIFQSSNRISVDLNKRLLPFIERLTEYYRKLSFNDFSYIFENLLIELFYICKLSKQTQTHAPDVAENLLKTAITYIENNWQNIKNIQEISTALFISHSYLYQIFSEKLNTTPKAYLMEKRLQAAHSFLLSGMSPHTVSTAVGFNTYTAFYRSFKSAYGKTPQEIYSNKKTSIAMHIPE